MSIGFSICRNNEIVKKQAMKNAEKAFRTNIPFYNFDRTPCNLSYDKGIINKLCMIYRRVITRNYITCLLCNFDDHCIN